MKISELLSNCQYLGLLRFCHIFILLNFFFALFSFYSLFITNEKNVRNKISGRMFSLRDSSECGSFFATVTISIFTLLSTNFKTTSQMLKCISKFSQLPSPSTTKTTHCREKYRSICAVFALLSHIS